MKTESEAKMAIMTMLKCFTSGESDLIDKRDLYFSILSPIYSAEQIVDVCSRAVRGEVGSSGRFPPTTAELCIALRGPELRKPLPYRRNGDDAFVSSSGRLYLNGVVYERGEWESTRGAPAPVKYLDRPNETRLLTDSREDDEDGF